MCAAHKTKCHQNEGLLSLAAETSLLSPVACRERKTGWGLEQWFKICLTTFKIKDRCPCVSDFTDRRKWQKNETQLKSTLLYADGV